MKPRLKRMMIMVIIIMIIVIITMIGHACESRGDQGINNGEGERKDTED
jgi:hypothetical protein